jgi:hypothetical protein
MEEATRNTPTQVFSRECIAAVKEFRRAKPWRGNLEERRDKFTTLHNRLCAAYDLKMELEFADDIDPLGAGGHSRYHIHDGRITLHFKLSVVTYLVAIAHARGFPYAQAFTWAVALYRKMFPVSAARHIERDGLIVSNPGQ